MLIEGHSKTLLFLRVGDKLYEDLSFLQISEALMSPVAQGMLKYSSKVKDRLVYLAPLATQKAVQVLEAAYFTPWNTAPTHLLSDTKDESFKSGTLI